MLEARFRASRIFVKIARDDADVDIVQRAQQVPKSVVVGEDIDLLVLMVALTPPEKEVLFLKPGKSTGAQKDVFYSSQELQGQLQYTPQIVLVAHAFTGCDSTSGIYNKGKLCVHKLLQHGELWDSCEVFLQRNISPE